VVQEISFKSGNVNLFFYCLNCDLDKNVVKHIHLHYITSNIYNFLVDLATYKDVDHYIVYICILIRIFGQVFYQYVYILRRYDKNTQQDNLIFEPK